MKPKDGGQAFPAWDTERGQGHLIFSGGMTLRDYFAAAALHGIVSKSFFSIDVGINEYTRYAQHSYRLADAMLAEREKESAA